jgi:2'-5' RNA ligase
MSVVRAFIAIEFGEDLHRHLANVVEAMRAPLAGSPLRWVPTENIHLTLKFLGDVSPTNLALIKEMVSAEAANCKPFEIGVGGLDAFPNANRPRILWVGVEGPDELFELQGRIEAEAARFGYPPEGKAFAPHLTLGRVNRNAHAEGVRQVADVLKKQKVGYLGAERIEAVHIFKSDLQAGGAVYSKLLSAGFGAG